MAKKGKGKMKTRVSKNVKKYVKGAIQRKAETKQVYTVQVGQVLSNVDSIIDLSNIAQGTASQANREGDKIDLRQVKIRFQAYRKSGATAGTYDNCRVQVVQWRLNTTDTAFTGFSDTTENTATSCALAQPTKRTALTAKFRVLYDKWFTLTERGETASSYKNLHISIPAKKLSNVKFNSAATSGVNKLYFIIRGDYAPASGDGSNFAYSTRVLYKDI